MQDQENKSKRVERLTLENLSIEDCLTLEKILGDWIVVAEGEIGDERPVRPVILEMLLCIGGLCSCLRRFHGWQEMEMWPRFVAATRGMLKRVMTDPSWKGLEEWGEDDAWEVWEEWRKQRGQLLTDRPGPSTPPEE